MKAISDKVYEKLTADERVSLLIEAAARQDKAELRLLWETAPTVSMRGADLKVSKKWDELQLFTLTVTIMLQNFISPVYAACSVSWAIENDAITEGNDERFSAENLALALKNRSCELLSFVSAIDTLCEEIGFSRATLIAAFVGKTHCEKLELDIELLTHFADGIDESLEAEFMAGLRQRHPVLFPESETATA